MRRGREVLEDCGDAHGDQSEHAHLGGQLAEDGVDIDERSMAEEDEDGCVCWWW